MRSEAEKEWTHLIFTSLPGYPFFPCKICMREGFRGMGGCDHTVLERAQAMHPGLVLTPAEKTGEENETINEYVSDNGQFGVGA